MSVDSRSVINQFTNSIVELQVTKGYTTAEAYMFLAGYLGSHLASIVDQLPKAKRQEALEYMNRTTASKEIEIQLRKEMA